MALPQPHPNKVWAAIFALWGLFLSGVFAGFVGSPGILQAIRLQSLLSSKRAQVAQGTSQIQRLQAEAGELESSHAIQQREIRRVLGYAASDEIIFDFSAGEAL